MNIPLLLYLLYALKSGCALGGKKNNITDGETLDVTKDSEDSTAQLILEKENGLDGRKFEIKEGVRVTTILHNGVQVWKAGGGEKCTVATLLSKQDHQSLIAVRYVKEGEKVDKFKGYEMNGGKWTEIEEETFETKFKAIKGPDSVQNPNTLYISSRDPSKCHSIETHIDGVPSRVFIMEPGVTIRTVMNGDDSIWVSTSSTCSYSIAFFGGGEPKMLFAIFVAADGKESRGFRKYKVEDGTCSCIRKGQKKGWHVSKKKYGDKINKLKSNTNAVKKFTLDLSTDKDDEKCQVTRENKDGHTTRIYATKSGHTIEKVVDNGREVWSVPADHICFLCELHSSGKSKLLRLHVKSGNYIFTFHTFESSGEEWNGVDGKEFVRKLEEMKKRSESKKT